MVNHRSHKTLAQGTLMPGDFAGALARDVIRRARSQRSRIVTTSVFGLSVWKRTVDVLLSVVALILVAPLMLAVGLAIKLTSPGPVFFKQERIGLNRRMRDRRRSLRRHEDKDRRENDRRTTVKFGKPFTIFKFRSMILEAENGTPVWAVRKDPRITPLGRVLRKSRIDELPQFFNVLLGDMSIVGPRPERAFFIHEAESEIPDFPLRLRVKPGITGLAQVRVGYTNTVNGLREKLKFDLEYMKRLSPVTDLKILMQTVLVVLTGKGTC